MEANLEETTGKTLAEWKAVLSTTKLEKHGQIVAWLKQDHGLTHGYANFISLKYREADAASSDTEDLVTGQYAKKPDLKPIYDALVAYCKDLGSDVDVVPKKAAVSIRRNRQFLLIKPATKTRMDVGLKFTDREPEGILLDSGAFGTMCTHRIELSAAQQVNDEVKSLIKQAYLEAG
ncbi:DUF5655 domain-containing protein [Alteromonas sp. H39]|uniref:DUF5655 domain-containing protein n=1 Tax=Alteromonas sp. H39 TaxID=3389876 RepID=UPI0039DFC58D